MTKEFINREIFEDLKKDLKRKEITALLGPRQVEKLQY